MKSWEDFHGVKAITGYYFYFKKQYESFLTQIEPNKKLYIELGCGLGNTTRWISEKNKEALYIVTDQSLEILNQCAVNCRNVKYLDYVLDLENTEDSTLYRILDHFKVDPSEVLVHSHGVLEHFKDETITRLVKQIRDLRIDQTHYVPLDKWIIPSRGDERLLSLTEWELLTKFDSCVTFNEERDLSFTTKGNK